MTQGTWESWTAEYVGATAMVRLEVFRGGVPSLYGCAVYDWFDRRPLYVSGSDLTLIDAKVDAEQEAKRYAGIAVADVIWKP